MGSSVWLATLSESDPQAAKARMSNPNRITIDVLVIVFALIVILRSSGTNFTY